MTDPAGLEKAMLHNPLEDRLKRETPSERVEEEEEIDKAQAADDLEQDPDLVPNRRRQQEPEPEPPRRERVGPDAD